METLLQSSEPWFAAAAILLLGGAVALAVGLALRLVARRLLHDEARAHQVSMIAFWGIAVIFGLVALSRLFAGEAAEAGLAAAGDRLFTALPDLVIALVILVAGFILATAAGGAVIRRLAPRRRRAAELVAAGCRTGLILVAVLLAARQVGIQTALAEALLLVLFAAGLLAGSLAAGLGGREVAAALAASQHTRDVLTVGDVVEVDGRRGRILRLGRTSVRLDLGDGVTAEVPNTALLAATIVVFEHREERVAPAGATAGSRPTPPRGATAAGRGRDGHAAGDAARDGDGDAARDGHDAGDGDAAGGAIRAGGRGAGDEDPAEAPTRTLPSAPEPVRPSDPARQVPARDPSDSAPPGPGPTADADRGALTDDTGSRVVPSEPGSAGEREPTRRFDLAALEDARREEARRSRPPDVPDEPSNTDVLQPPDRPGG